MIRDYHDYKDVWDSEIVSIDFSSLCSPFSLSPNALLAAEIHKGDKVEENGRLGQVHVGFWSP